MPSLTAISFERYGSKRWIRRESFGFASAETVTPIVAEELSNAVLAMPIAFIPAGEGYTLAAIMGLAPGQNLFVSEQEQWIGHYIPAAFRSNPFYLLPDGNGNSVLCIDEESGLVTDDPSAEPFFRDDAEPAESLNNIITLLNRIEASRQITQHACDALAKHNLIQPWPITLDGEIGEKRVAGLFRIDEVALNALSAESFQEVREAGALPIVYGQLFSMKHLQALGGLYSRRLAQESKPSTPLGDTFSF